MGNSKGRRSSSVYEPAQLHDPSTRVDDPIDAPMKSVLEQVKDAIDSPVARAVRQMYEQSDQLRAAIDNPLLRLAREAIDSPLARAVREIGEHSEQLQAAMDSPFPQLAKRLSEDANRWRRTMASITSHGSTFAKAMESIESQSALRVSPALLQAAHSPWAQVQRTLAGSSKLLQSISDSVLYDQSVIKQVSALARTYSISANIADSRNILASLRDAVEAARPDLETIADAGMPGIGAAEVAGAHTVILTSPMDSSGEASAQKESEAVATEWANNGLMAYGVFAVTVCACARVLSRTAEGLAASPRTSLSRSSRRAEAGRGFGISTQPLGW